jgi:hypothetical protein
MLPNDNGSPGKSADAKPTRPGLAPDRLVDPMRMPPWVDYLDGAMQSRDDEPVMYFIGIIDILTDWTCAKSAENIIKTISHPTKPNAHSCVPPHRYANRFERTLRLWID